MTIITWYLNINKYYQLGYNYLKDRICPINYIKEFNKNQVFNIMLYIRYYIIVLLMKIIHLTDHNLELVEISKSLNFIEKVNIFENTSLLNLALNDHHIELVNLNKFICVKMILIDKFNKEIDIKPFIHKYKDSTKKNNNTFFNILTINNIYPNDNDIMAIQYIKIGKKGIKEYTFNDIKNIHISDINNLVN